MSIPAHRPPLISRRISLRFLPSPPHEPTKTLVINGGGTSNLFTDFRPLIVPKHDGSLNEIPPFGGVKEFLGGSRCRWRKLVEDIVDSPHKPDTDPVEDEGECEELPNGDVLERGVMINPESGRLEPFEEVWRDEEVPDSARILVLVLPSKTSFQKDESLDGIWVLVGPVAQGVVRGDDGTISACRWRLGGDGDQRWKVEAKYGSAVDAIPVPQAVLQTGYQGSAWIVREDYAHRCQQ